MGKEWWYWGSSGENSSRSRKRGKSGGSHGENDGTASGCMSAVFRFFDSHPLQFAFHQQPSFKPQSFLPDEHIVTKGLEAPRNSLEVEEPFKEAAPLSSTIIEKENLNISMGIQIKTSVETNKSSCGVPRARADDLSSECSSSPGSKTPNLVARLMGLDLLPETGSPVLSVSHYPTSNPPPKSHFHAQMQSLKQDVRSRQLLNKRNFLDDDITGTHSLPETPRISSARKSDVDYHHRLSLQIKKENTGDEFKSEFSSYLAAKMSRRREIGQEENKSSAYARQKVKQVKESVSRRVGLDITNTINSNRDQGRTEHVVVLKAIKPLRISTKNGDEEQSTSKPSTLTFSPRLTVLETKNTALTPSSAGKQQISQSPKLSTSQSSSSANRQTQSSNRASNKATDSQVPSQEERQHRNHKQNSVQKCKKAGIERFDRRLKNPPQTSDYMIRNKQEEPFVRSAVLNKANLSDKKCKKTLLCNELVNINVPNLFPVKKDPLTSTAKLPQKLQVSDALSLERTTQLSSSSSQSYEQEKTQLLITQDKIDNSDRCSGVGNAATSNGEGAEFHYISKILKRTGVDRKTPVSVGRCRWYSPSHPLDPSIFHHLELAGPTPGNCSSKVLNQRCDRKLVFELVDELLAGILEPFLNGKPWVSTATTKYGEFQMDGSELVDRLCEKIRGFPSADCQVLEDIDRLIDKDIGRVGKLQNSAALEEEGEGMVAEIERGIVETLVHETTVQLFGGLRR